MISDITCEKKDMLLVNYEAPDGQKRHNRLWNGGNGVGTIQLFDHLEKLIDRSLHVPLNSTLNAVFYIPEKECLAAFEEAEQEAVGKRKLKELMRPVAEKLQADLVVLPVLTGYEQYETMSWYRWGRHITHSYAAVEIMGYDKAKDEVFSKGATRQFHDEYSTQADVSLLAYEAMDEALQRANIHERIWTWRER